MKQRRILHLDLLGGLHVRRSSGRAVRLPTRKSQALLAYLAVRAGLLHSRESLATLLWGDMGEAQVRANLRHCLFTLRQVLDDDADALALEPHEVVIDPAGVATDVAAFERAAAEPAHLPAAAALYRGEFLEGFSIREASYEEWLRGERERLRMRALDVFERCVESCAAAGRLEDAVTAGGRALSIDPLCESVHRALMRVHAAGGQRGAVVRQYQTCVEALRRELGTDPEAETTRLYRELVGGPGPGPAAPASQRRAPRAAAPVPARATPLIGRDVAMHRLAGLLDHVTQGNGRVLCVAGDAGIAKTRLVQEIGALAQRAGARVVIGHSYPSDERFALGAWVDALRAGVVHDGALLASLDPRWRAELATLVPSSRSLARRTPGATPCACSKRSATSWSAWPPPRRSCSRTRTGRTRPRCSSSPSSRAASHGGPSSWSSRPGTRSPSTAAGCSRC